ncbi:cobalamin B12-binding domain-containing protein [Streptomyces bauhiniae]|uniref:cobalamin B12-binding domain-containing protein n=1 Tax=Streptomyces bauhiniae TaxID=2340725 RepID=UPI0033A4AB2A
MTTGTGTAVQERAELSERVWTAVIAKDESAAVREVFAAADAGAGRESLLLEVLGGVQRRVGTEWAADRISVAEEHAATAIIDRVIAALAHRVPAPAGAPGRPRITVACVDGEWHVLPARLLAEVLTGRGWQVDFLGAHTTTPHLIAHLHATNPAVTLLSASLPLHLPSAHIAVTAVQSIGIPVMVGGAAFGPDGRYARLIGADAWAPDARAAAGLLADGLVRPEPTTRQQVDDLPHLADQEYTLVKGNRSALVRQSLAALDERWPGMRAYTEAQRERTAEDLAHIVDFLATALYVDDTELFTGFVTWTAEILRARRVPPHSLRTGLDILAGELRDFPRALGFLRAAAEALPAPSATRPSPGPGKTA